MPDLVFVYDRTEADVERARYFRGKRYDDLTAEEKAEYAGGLKGAYNASDLARVDSNTVAIAELLAPGGYRAVISPHGEWANDEFPTAAQLERVRQNIAALRGAIKLPSTAPEVPDNLNPMGIHEANTIEKLQFLVYDLLKKSMQSMRRTGTFYCGEGMLI